MDVGNVPATPANRAIITRLQVEALLTLAIATAAISLFCCLLVLGFHSFMLWYKPAAVDRVSLRLIILSAGCNVLFTILKLVFTKLDDTSLACNVLAYFVVTSDVMASTCLAMVSLNLVLIFIVRVVHPQALEKYYYVIIIVIALLVAMVPLGVTRGRHESYGYVCWYRYYYIGRATVKFEWMWYYSWLLFAALLAVVCAALALVELKRNQNFYAQSLDMGPPAEGPLEAGQRIRTSQARSFRGNQKSTVIFRKVVIRCLIYATVPIVANIWGICVQLVTMTGKIVPYPILVLERVFDNMFGCMMCCIYFTDPTIKSIIRDIFKDLKRRYVDEYYMLQVDPDMDRDTSALQSQRIWISEKAGSSSIIHRIERVAQNRWTRITGDSRQISASIVSSKSSLRPSASPHIVQSGIPESHSVEEIGQQRSAESRPVRRFTYPNINVHWQQEGSDSSSRHPRHAQSASAVERKRKLSSLVWPCMKIRFGSNIPGRRRANISISKPMRLIRDPTSVYRTSDDDYWQLGRHIREDKAAESSSRIVSNGHNGRLRLEMIEPYNHPHFAMFMHWLFLHVFRISPEEPEVHEVVVEQEQPSARQQEESSTRFATPETSAINSSGSLYVPSIDTSPGGTPADEEMPMTWDMHRAKENKLLIDIDEEGFTERQRALSRRKMKDSQLLSVPKQAPMPSKQQFEDFGPSSAASSLASGEQASSHASGSSMLVAGITDSENSSSRKEQQASNTTDSSEQMLAPQISNEPRRPSRVLKELQPLRQSREEKRTIFNVLSLRTPPVLQRRASRRHIYDATKEELYPPTEVPAIKLGHQESRSHISGDSLRVHTPSVDIRSSRTSASSSSQEKSRRSYAIPLAPRPKSSKAYLAVEEANLTGASDGKWARPVDRPPSMLAVDVGLLRSDEHYVDPHSLNRVTHRDIRNAARAFDQNAGFQHACTRLTFITSWEADDGHPRIYNFEEKWCVDDIIETQVERAASVSYATQDT